MVAQGVGKAQNFRVNEKKWGRPLMEAGWCLLPTMILEHQRDLDLNAVDVNILMHLVRHWWQAERLPYPTKKTIADCMGVHPSTVQRRIRRMEKLGIVRREERFDRERGQMGNAYDLSGLERKATPFAKDELARRKARGRERGATQGRKPHQLTIVSPRGNPA